MGSNPTPSAKPSLTIRHLPLLFASTLFVSAVLLFWVQPLVAQMLLPLLGGTPSVWNVCMVFFQATLLAGYAYAHCSTRWFGVHRQVVIHLIMLAAAFALLPFGVPERAVQSLVHGARPVAWLIGTLFLTVGFPFLVVSTTAPLLQKWFSHTNHPSAGDPYFLYAASNLGSLIVLLAFPTVLQPMFPARLQSRLWTGVFGVLALFVAACAATGWRAREERTSQQSDPNLSQETGATNADGGINWPRRLRWILWAFIPSSLMLGVTQYLSTDIATFPLLWVLPLALYLTTFILVFARRRLVPDMIFQRALPILAVVLLFLVASKATQPIWLLMAVHLLFFFVAAMNCHGLLANDRPPVAHLTEYYFWMSGGGVLGGLFNALLAPLLFHQIVEYPLVIVLACLAVGVACAGASHTNSKRQPVHLGNTPHPTFGHPFPSSDEGRGQGEGCPFPNDAPSSIANWFQARIRWLDLALPAGLLGLSVLLGMLTGHWLKAPVQIVNLAMFGLPMILVFLWVNRPVRFVSGLGAVLLAGAFYQSTQGHTLETRRTFFGVSRVTVDAAGRFRQLYHDNTVHGRQFIQPDRQGEPLSYYHRTGPLGQIFQAFDTKPQAASVAAVGLGAGAAACYARPGQSWTIYEIDPTVVRIASDTNHFTYLQRCAAQPLRMVLGDARLQLRNAPDGGYHLMILDAFSSDAIPVHLLTREAVRLYAAKLAPGGLLAFHISNRNLDLKPVIGDLADAERLVCLGRDNVEESDPEYANGKDPSQWVVMARRIEDFGPLAQNQSWQRLRPRPQPKPWTDDFSNILTSLRWE